MFELVCVHRTETSSLVYPTKISGKSWDVFPNFAIYVPSSSEVSFLVVTVSVVKDCSVVCTSSTFLVESLR